MATLETTSFDEAYDGDGLVRAQYAALLEALEAGDLLALRESAQRRVDALGASFGEHPFRVDPVPRLFEADAWERLAGGLRQRVRALNAFVRDVYGERRIVAEGVVPARVVEEAEGYEPELQGRLPDGVVPPVAIAGLDVVCDEQGTLRVLEDNCRTPSGYCYALATRCAVSAALDVGELLPRALAAPLRELLTGVLRAAAPRDVDDPCIVVLSEGPGAGTAFEHEQVALLAGAELATPDDRRLSVLDGRLCFDGRRVDVVYRRTDADGMRGRDGALTPAARLLVEPWLGGRLGLVNGFGTGVADDKLAHAYVEDMIGFYLGERPLLASVRTLDLGRHEHVEEVLDDLRSFVVKPRAGAGGDGVVVCAHADDHALAEVRERLRREPEAHVAQRLVALSRHPTVSEEGRLEPRHVDLRPFIFSGDGWTRVLPGALTRVALDRGTLVVNSSQHGGGKDTWVLQQT